MLDILNHYSAFITAIATVFLVIGTFFLAYITYLNIKEERNIRRSDKEKDLIIKVLSNILLLIEYVHTVKRMTEEKIKLDLELNNHYKEIKKEDFQYSFDYLIKASSANLSDLITQQNKVREILLYLSSIFCLVPNEIEHIVSLINKDLKVFHKNVEEYNFNGSISIQAYNLYKAEIELNMKIILQDANFSLVRFQWQK